MPGRLELGTSWRSHAAAQDARPAERGAARRLLLMADFSGRASRAAHDAPGLRERRPLAVDFERFDTVLRALAPRVATPWGTLQIESLDDFHPDRWLARLPAVTPGQDTSPADTTAQAQAQTEDDTATLGRLLGRAPTATTPAAASPAATAPRSSAAVGIEALLQRVVAPHVVAATPGPAPQQTAAMGARLRAVLADRGVQAVEAAWRSVDLLLSRLNFDDGLELHVLDCTREEIAGDLVAAGGLADSTGLLRALTAGSVAQPDDAPWIALVGLHDFDDSTLDLALLAALGTLAQRCRAPFIGGAAPALLQAALGDRTSADWRSLRRSEVAAWLALAGPRLLLRTPYGKRGGNVETMPFEELDAAGAIEGLLWAPGSLLCALAIGQAVNENRPDPLRTEVFEADGLPAVLTEEHGLLCVPMRLGQAEADALQQQGLVALRGHKGRHSLAVSALHSLVGADQPLGG